MPKYSVEVTGFWEATATYEIEADGEAEAVEEAQELFVDVDHAERMKFIDVDVDEVRKIAT